MSVCVASSSEDESGYRYDQGQPAKGDWPMWLRGRFFRTIGVLWVVGLGVVVSLCLNVAYGESRIPDPAGSAGIVSRAGDAVPSPSPYPTIEDSAGYIVPRAHFLATIFHAVEERQGLSTGDHVVIDAGANQNVQVGDWFSIVRKTPTLHHPVTNQAVGILVATLGYAVAVRVQPSAAILRLTKTFGVVELGDQVTPFEPPPAQVTRATLSPTPRDIKGYITATKDGKVSVGEGDIVYLDRGEAEGVRVGDRFNVLREGDRVRHPITHRLLRLPRQVFGKLTVLDVRTHTATALITSSLRELSAATPVELQEPRVLEAALQSDDTATAAGVDQVEARLAQLLPCLEVARQAIHTAAAAGATDTDLASARSALASAEQRIELARAALAQADVEQARQHLDAAQADCLSAQELSRYTGTAEQAPTAAGRYTVRRGDSLWGISAQADVYQNPFMWPMLYKANGDRIRDPDLIFPKQILAIPRAYSQEEADTAIQRARKRGPWRLGDGPDQYILEGIRQKPANR
jgi:LysM repeat protein